MQTVPFDSKYRHELPDKYQASDPSAEDLAIRVRGLRKAYGGREVVQGIDLDVFAGEIFGLLGPNGAGKTTTIEILEAYRQRSAGEVSVLGVDPARPTRAWRDRIGFVLQDCQLNPALSIRETLRMFGAFYSQPRRAEDAISLVGLDDQADARLGSLSGGQRRRADLAVALIGDPDLVFLDEPTTGLDPTARREAWRMIEGLRDMGKTVLLTTHYMDEAQHLSDRVAIMRSGKIVVAGPPAQLTGELARSTRLSFRLPDGAALTVGAVVAGQLVKVEDQLFTIETDRPQHMLHSLLDWAEAEHVELNDLSVWKPSLEDIFLELTGGAHS
jgi:ABC-2 type transport system ATP-binding protein